MRKVKATIFYPVQSSATKDVVIEVPDDVSPETYINDYEIDIIKREVPELDDPESALDLGYAGIDGIAETVWLS